MGSEFTPILLLIALLAVFYIMVIRPARRQQQATATIQRNLEVGDDVVLSSGIYGTVAVLEEDRVQIEIAPGTVITVARQVVVRRVEDEPGAAPTTYGGPDQHRDDDERLGEEKD